MIYPTAKVMTVVLTTLVICQLSSAEDLQVTNTGAAKGPYDSHYAIYSTSAITTDTDQCAQHGV